MSRVRDVGKVQKLRTAEVSRPAGGGARLLGQTTWSLHVTHLSQSGASIGDADQSEASYSVAKYYN